MPWDIEIVCKPAKYMTHKIQNELCTVRQSNDLRKLGITAPSVWVYDNGTYRIVIDGIDLKKAISLYSVGELGIMLAGYTRDCVYEPEHGKWQALPGTRYYDTQAECYAEKLLENLKVGMITASDCNERMNNA